MGQNTIHILFKPCEPTPAAGYRVRYRPLGSMSAYRIWPARFFSSPIVFNDFNDPKGTDYEFIIDGDCGGDRYGVPISGTAMNEGCTGGSSSAPASSSAAPSSEGPSVMSGPFRVGTNPSNLCSIINVQNLFWLGPGPALVTGNVMYTDIGLTTPLTGWNNISDSVGTEIFGIDSTTGEVGFTTGAGC